MSSRIEVEPHHQRLAPLYLRRARGLPRRHGRDGVYERGFSQKIAINAFLCVCGLLVLKFEKKIYASPLGFVKDTHTWFSHHREVLRWDEIRHVTLVTKGMGLTAFLEKDVVGWKLLFERNDMAALDGLFKKYAPKVKVVIKEMGQR